MDAGLTIKRQSLNKAEETDKTKGTHTIKEPDGAGHALCIQNWDE
jgi:hypothetical protein